MKEYVFSHTESGVTIRITACDVSVAYKQLQFLISDDDIQKWQPNSVKKK